MEISAFINHYLDPTINAPQLETKPLKAPEFEQDVQRFEAIVSGEGAYQPKSIEFLTPMVESNSIQSMGHALVNKVANLKETVNGRINRINAEFQSAEDLDISDMLRLQYEISMFGVESSLIAKSGDKAGEGIKTLFRNQ
jgi:hypothetical protein